MHISKYANSIETESYGRCGTCSKTLFHKQTCGACRYLSHRPSMSMIPKLEQPNLTICQSRKQAGVGRKPADSGGRKISGGRNGLGILYV